jgi:hypothetical protein
MCSRFALILLLGTGLAASGSAAQPPLSQSQILEMVRSGTPAERVVESIQQNGIDFKPEKGFLKELREAGAGKAVIQAVRKAKRVDSPSLQRSGSPDAQRDLEEHLSTPTVAVQGNGASVTRSGGTVRPPSPFTNPIHLAPQKPERPRYKERQCYGLLSIIKGTSAASTW